MKNILFLALVGLFLFTNCNDGSVIGNELLDNEELSLNFDDNFELSGDVLRGDSVATYRDGTINQTYLLGEVEEPVFGKYSSDIYTGLAFNSTLPNYTGSTLDSIVLELEYDTLGFYGDTNAIYNIEVFRVLEDFIAEDTIFSDKSFMTEMMSIGSVSLRPSATRNLESKARIVDVDSTVIVTPRLRIPLANSIGEEILADGAAAATDSALIGTFKGFYIKATVEGSNSMIGLNFNENPDFNDGIARLVVYHTQINEDEEEEKETYQYILRSVTHSQFIHDYTSSIVGNALSSASGDAEYLFVQNMAGVNSEISLPELSALEGTLINAAQLVVTVSEEDALFDTDLYPPSTRYLLSRYNDDGDRVLIQDLLKTGLTLNNAIALFDGEAKDVELESGETVKQIIFNITDYIKSVIDENKLDPKVVISPIGRQETPRRTVFYGPDHQEYPPVLRIAYTIN